MVREPFHLIASHVHSRTSQFNRGCSQSGMCGFGVDPTPRGVQGSLPGMGFSSSGSFRHSSDLSSPSVCVTSSGLGSMETRCVLLPLGRSRSLRLSSLRSHPLRSGDSGFAVCTDDVDGSPVAAGRLVSPTAGSLGGQSMGTAVMAVPSLPAPSSSLPQVSRNALASRVETLLRLFRARGFSRRAARFLSQPVRQSSSSVYRRNGESTVIGVSRGVWIHVLPLL